MKNTIIVTGSLAFDTLFYHNGILEESFIHSDFRSLNNVAFNVRSQEQFYGGCAGNIIYNALLIHTNQPSPFRLIGIVGNDFEPYKKWLLLNKIDTSLIVHVPDTQTAHAYVMSDRHGQQLTFFYEGPGLYPEKIKILLTKNLNAIIPQGMLMHIAPNSYSFMMICLEKAKEFDVPYFFDPGQAINLFTKEELYTALSQAHGAFFNESEYRRACERMSLDIISILINKDTKIKFIVITKSEKGSLIYVKNGPPISIPAVKKAMIDPTGCGDAYRGGFLATLYQEIKKIKPSNLCISELFSDVQKARSFLQKAGQAGTSLAARCLGVKGTQCHTNKSL